MTCDEEHIFKCLFAICVSSLVKCIFRFWVHFKIRSFVFLLNFKSSLYILDNSSLSDVFCKFFLPVCKYFLLQGLSSHSLDIVFYEAGVFNFNFNEV